jgi:hypothetical protein
VEYADGRLDVAEIRFLVVHSSQLAQQAATAYAAAQAKEAERVAEHIQRVEARWFACAADAEAAISDYEGRGQGRRGRKPRLWRYHALHYRVEAVSLPKKRTRRGRPPKAETPEVAVRYRLVVSPEAVVLPEEAQGWTVLATTLRSVYGCRDTPGLSGATYHRRTRLSLDQKPGSHQSGVVGETRTDCRLGDAHGGGVARVCRDSTAGSPLSPRPSPTNPRE